MGTSQNDRGRGKNLTSHRSFEDPRCYRKSSRPPIHTLPYWLILESQRTPVEFRCSRTISHAMCIVATKTCVQLVPWNLMTGDNPRGFYALKFVDGLMILTALQLEWVAGVFGIDDMDPQEVATQLTSRRRMRFFLPPMTQAVKNSPIDIRVKPCTWNMLLRRRYGAARPRGSLETATKSVVGRWVRRNCTLKQMMDSQLCHFVDAQ